MPNLSNSLPEEGDRHDHGDPIGVVIIGRNEGERLRRCLRSVVGKNCPVIYVDSGSTDGSVELARRIGATVVELSQAIQFSAARARNVGFERLQQLAENVEFVQFIDGDCAMAPAWLDRARAELVAHPDVGAVCGRLRELDPEASIYNRLCDLEWDRPVGETNHCGGIFMVRALAFQSIGGFDSTVPAGEEPELCQRLRRQCWRLIRLPDQMGWHDAGMNQFAQWWRRQTRGGYSGLDVHLRFGINGHSPFAGQIRSTRMWTLGFPGVGLVAVAIGWSAGGSAGAVSAGVTMLLLLPVQILRIALRTSRAQVGFKVALANGVFTMIGKWAQLWGQCRYLCDRHTSGTIRLVDYKTISAESAVGHTECSRELNSST
jgi:hypothetical protein